MNTQMYKQELQQTSKHQASLLSMQYTVAILRHKSGQLPTWGKDVLVKTSSCCTVKIKLNLAMYK